MTLVPTNDRPTQFIQIDEEGCFSSGGVRLKDDGHGCDLFEAFHYDDQHRLRTADEQVVECFDAPFIVKSLGIDATGLAPRLSLKMPYGFESTAHPKDLSLDEWDRFHGYTESGIAFVLSRSAQMQLFNACDEYDDESITLKGETFTPGQWLAGDNSNAQPQFWNNIYETEEVPRFDLQAPSPALVDLLDRLKMPKCRVAVLGAGQGHDAAHFAERGHLVTAFDFSPQAIERIQKMYGHHKTLSTVQADVLNLPTSWNAQFDVVFEHTCYCAINPTDRNRLVTTWNRILVDRGQLLGVFFAMDKVGGPPYGGSEWEVRERLRKRYQFVYWSRTHASKPSRIGKEFVVLGTKLGMGDY
jgi:SAM-dependent methyltransferase